MFFLTFNDDLFHTNMDDSRNKKRCMAINKYIISPISNNVVDMDTNTYVTWKYNIFTWYYYNDSGKSIKITSLFSFKSVTNVLDGIFLLTNDEILYISSEEINNVNSGNAFKI